MCFLPPACVFCKHYHLEDDDSPGDCAAFREIPEEIMSGEFFHIAPYPGDGGYLFDLDPDMEAEYLEVEEMRRALGQKAAA